VFDVIDPFLLSLAGSTRHDYWLLTGLVAVTNFLLVALMVDVDHLEVYQALQPRTLLRLSSVHFAAVNVAVLLPEKAWCVRLACVALSDCIEPFIAWGTLFVAGYLRF
jgi:hypothetical protein